MYSPPVLVPAEKKKLHQISFPSKVDLWQFYSLLFSEAHHFLPDAERHGWKKRVREHHLVCRSMVYSALSGWFTDSSVFRALKPKLIKWEQVISRWGIWPQSTIHLVVHIHIWFFFFDMNIVTIENVECCTQQCRGTEVFTHLWARRCCSCCSHTVNPRTIRPTSVFLLNFRQKVVL